MDSLWALPSKNKHMKFLIQRVSQASVSFGEPVTTNAIGKGFLIYVGVHKDDVNQDWKEKVDKFVRRVDKLQLFDEVVVEPVNPLPSASPLKKGRKLSWLREFGGELLVISNFTLYGRNKKAWSVDFTHAASYDDAQKIYEYLIAELKNKGLSVQTWEFGAMMEVSSTLDGPVNVVLER